MIYGTKEKTGHYVMQFEVPFKAGEVEKIRDLIKSSIENAAEYGATIDHIDIRPSASGVCEDTVYIDFYLKGYDFTNRDSHKATVKPLTRITCWVLSCAGFSSYELCMSHEEKGTKTIENADAFLYELRFNVDANIRPYRCKHWKYLETPNHFIWNDDLDSQEFKTDIGSYICNLLAHKHVW